MRITPGLIGESIVGAAFNLTAVLFSPLLRSWYSHWGATEAETRRPVQGDDLAPHPLIQSTRVVTIQSFPENIWPWLMQIGFKRAGWYSYDLLEALVGAAGFIDGRSANRIIPELQGLKPGDLVFMHPRIPGLKVHTLEPNRILVFQTRLNSRTGKYFDLKHTPPTFVNTTWVFYLEKTGNQQTRLLIRSRFDYNRSFMNAVVWKFITDPLSFVMERKMLLGIKRRAEAM
jgi:hypothetical protein